MCMYCKILGLKCTWHERNQLLCCWILVGNRILFLQWLLQVGCFVWWLLTVSVMNIGMCQWLRFVMVMCCVLFVVIWFWVSAKEATNVERNWLRRKSWITINTRSRMTLICFKIMSLFFNSNCGNVALHTCMVKNKYDKSKIWFKEMAHFVIYCSF